MKKRVLKYNNGKKTCLTLHADDIGVIKGHVDAFYAIHNDCRGHIGAIMTFGGGVVTRFSQKEKNNMKSSIEAELIGVDDTLPPIL